MHLYETRLLRAGFVSEEAAMGRRRRWWVVVACAVVVACGGVPGGAEGDLSRAAGDSGSALAAVQLALEQYSADRTTRNHAVTVAADALEEVLGAYDTVAELEIGTDTESAHRTALLRRLGEAAELIGDTRSHLDGLAAAPDQAALDAGLVSLTDSLSAFAEGER